MRLLLIVVALAILVWIMTELINSQTGTAAQIALPAQPDGSPTQPAAAAASPAQDPLAAMALAIGRFEGFFKVGSLAQRDDNPGDLEKVGGGFQVFDDVSEGWNAVESYIQKHVDANPNWNFFDFFNHYLGGSATTAAPASQGNVQAYANFVAGQLGVDPTSLVATYLAGGA